MTTRRTICVLTGSRADYGLLYWLLKTLAADPGVTLQLIVSGSHLNEAFGCTQRLIAADGFVPAATVDIILEPDTRLAVATSLGLATTRFAEELARLRPYIAVVLGDRYEALAFAQAAMMLGVPLAHIHGGERTEGVIDEAVRHAISKMAHLHFTTAEPYRQRVIQLGEEPTRIFTVGAPGLDNVARLMLPSRDGLTSALGVSLVRPFFLVTYHPETLDRATPARAITALCDALDRFPELDVIVTKANADAYGRLINERFASYSLNQPERVRVFDSLGQANFLAAIREAAAVVGNSSSGLIEAPAIGTPTVNIGDRQRGRLRAPSVIDCATETATITAALAQAMSPAFRAQAMRRESPYGGPGAAAKMAEILTTVPPTNLLVKRFYDLPIAC